MPGFSSFLGLKTSLFEILFVQQDRSWL